MPKPPKLTYGVRLPPKQKPKPPKKHDPRERFPGLRRLGLAGAFKDPNLVGSQNELTDFDGTTISSGGNTTDGGGAGGGSGANPLAGDKLAALRALETKPTRRIGRKKSDRAPSRSRVY